MTQPAYEDFDLVVRGGDGYTSQITQSPAGSAEAPVSWPFAASELDTVITALGHSRAVRPGHQPFDLERARDFGEKLFSAVLPSPLDDMLYESIDAAGAAGTRLRLRLQTVDAPELGDVPWEYLYSDHLGRFVAVSSDTPLVRYLTTDRSQRPLAVDSPLRVVVMMSSPVGLPPLDVDGEWQRLTRALAPLVERGLVATTRLREPTLSELQKHLRSDTAHIMHYVGHGDFDADTAEGVLLLEADDGQAIAVTGEDLGTLLHDHHSLRLVVLNSCEGARSTRSDPFSGVAQALVRQGLPAVAAMQFEISDDAAIDFSASLYEALADGYPVDAAMSEARKTMFAARADTEWGTPVLFMQVPDGRIFDQAPVEPRRPWRYLVVSAGLLLIVFVLFLLQRNGSTNGDEEKAALQAAVASMEVRETVPLDTVCEVDARFAGTAGPAERVTEGIRIPFVITSSPSSIDDVNLYGVENAVDAAGRPFSAIFDLDLESKSIEPGQSLSGEIVLGDVPGSVVGAVAVSIVSGCVSDPIHVGLIAVP